MSEYFWWLHPKALLLLLILIVALMGKYYFRHQAGAAITDALTPAQEDKTPAKASKVYR
jgi:H+/Cl- antiporter ClcA